MDIKQGVGVVGVILGALSVLGIAVFMYIAFVLKKIPQPANQKGPQGPVGAQGPVGPQGSVTDPSGNPLIKFQEGYAIFDKSAKINGGLTVYSNTTVLNLAASGNLITTAKLASDTTATAATTITTQTATGKNFYTSTWRSITYAGSAGPMLGLTDIPAGVNFTNPPKIQVLARNGALKTTPPVPSSGLNNYVFDISNMGNSNGDSGWTATWTSPTNLTITFAKRWWCAGDNSSDCIPNPATAYVQVILYY